MNGRIASALRLTTALVLLLGAVTAHYTGGSFWVGVVLWFALASAIGLVLGRWWALLLAAVPWPVGVGLGLATGRYLFLGEAWQFTALISVEAGLIGIALGVVVRRVLQRPPRART